MHPVNFALKGRVQVSLLRGGETVLEQPWTRNLLLDQGLDQMAETPLCDIFLYCAKGTDTEVTSETLPDAYTWNAASTTVTRSVGTARDFDVGDEGRLLRFTASGREAKILTWINSASVTVDRTNDGSSLTSVAADLYRVNQIGLGAEQDRTGTLSSIATEQGTTTVGNVRTFQRTFVFDAEPDDEEAVTGTYSQSGFTITRNSGSRDFTSGDVGKKIYFASTGEEYVISSLSSATQVSVATSATVAAQAVKLYGFVDYTEIGFSHEATPGDNLNIRIQLGSAVRAFGNTGTAPAEQVKVTYEQALTIEPDTVQPSSSTWATFPINDPGNLMSSNKQGRYTVENILTSEVTSTGATTLANALLDPGVAGFCGLSALDTALEPLDGPIRSAGTFSKAFEAQSYVAGSFERAYRATFTINEAVGDWWSFMLYDPDSGLSAFTWKFRHEQTKGGEHTLSLDLTKTWARDLS